ncbi:hypothetical protein OHA72_54245 [Dactylosporangium sp. NBC_01737]|uniref:hypothetical protein n=1 Tax=Dactylosporangium sp. NBC_01737 TaxID=2975959 RepID=UPI002E0D694E|nr:hypothetical protein OHA72_54245 [Dactylosporangium sp. NBC_01737]
MTELAVPRQAIASAARALAHAGRWLDASALLDAAPPEDPLLALASAQVAIELDWFAGTTSATQRLATATRLADGLDDAGRWDLAFAELRNAYRTLLMTDRSTQAPAPDDEILRRAAELGASAPDAVRNGWAEMYQGLIADNLLDRPAAAPAHYAAALEAGAGDPLLAREALRHLGGHDHDAGNHDRALERWHRATELGAAGGNVPGTLSQQLLLAVLARDTGNEPAAVALATEIARWAGAIGAGSLAGQATAFLDGTDPVAPPPTTARATTAATSPAGSASVATPATTIASKAKASVAAEPAAPGTPIAAAESAPSASVATGRGPQATRPVPALPAEAAPPAIVSFMTAPLATTPRQ